MEGLMPSTAAGGGPESEYDQELGRTRSAMRMLREKMVQRVIARTTNRLDGRAPDLRVRMDHYPSLDENKRNFEATVAQILVKCLVDQTTLLPIDADTVHKRILRGQAGGQYERALAHMGLPGPHALVAKLCAGHRLLEALQLQMPSGSLLVITNIDLPALCNFTGVEIPPGRRPEVLPPITPGMPPITAGPPGFMPPIAPRPGGMGGMPSIMPGVPGVPGGMPSILHGQGMGGAGPGLGGPMGGDASMVGMGGDMAMGAGQQGPGQQGEMGGGKRPRAEGGDDLEALLSRKTMRDRVGAGMAAGSNDLVAVLSKPSARQAAALEQFRTAGGATAIQEHCPALTREDCRRQSSTGLACHRVHFRRLTYPWTDPSLGNCSYLNTCRNIRNCKYMHYEVDEEGDAPQGPGVQGGFQGNKAPLPVPKYLQALAQPQWVRCDVRTLDMQVLGKFGVIMADPPWQIHQDLPYGTMEDDEMRRMNIGCLQDDGVLFLWVTGRAMELARECMKIWGYDRVDELIWVKTNQLNRLIRTGRTGHWINHSKEHCLVGVKGKPQLNKYVDCDVVVAEVRETSRKPDEMYSLLERLSPGTRKLEIFARSHNLNPGWVGLGNQLNGVQIVDPEMRARYEARYGKAGPDGKLPEPI